jgi:hypothetical protein
MTSLEPKKTFAQKVDLRSRQAMVEFLAGHERYYTMNSWNRSTSYANNVKIHRVLPDELFSQALDLLDIDEVRERLNDVLTDFAIRHGYRWQICWNGRSSGYLVLYRGERRLSEHKSVCTACGQRNFKSVSDGGARCGACGRGTRVDRDLYDIVIHSGWGVGEHDDEGEFADWAIDDLRDEVRVVQDFDRACDDVVDEMICLCLGYEVVEEQVMVAHTVKVLREVA